MVRILGWKHHRTIFFLENAASQAMTVNDAHYRTSFGDQNWPPRFEVFEVQGLCQQAHDHPRRKLSAISTHLCCSIHNPILCTL